MPSAVKCIFQYDTMKAEADLGRLVIITNEATRRMAARINEAQAGNGSSLVPESMAGRQMADVAASTGKNFGKGFGMAGGAVAAPMFISVLRDSFASAASGAPISQIIGQQAPQVLQAITMMFRTSMARIMGLLGTVGAAVGAMFGAHWLGGKFGEAIFGSPGDFAAQNEMLRAKAERYRELRKEAIELAKAEKEVQDQRDKERNASYDSRHDLNKLMFENRVKNMASEADRHKARLDNLKSELELANQELETKKGLQFNSNPAISIEYFKAAIKQENAKQAIIDENKSYLESKNKQSMNQQFQVTERERIGLGAASSVQVSLLDINKQSLAVQKEMRDHMRRVGGDSTGSF